LARSRSQEKRKKDKVTENTRPEGLHGENSQNTSRKGATMSSTEKEQKRISRREFVKGAAVGAAGVAAAGALASCTTATPEVVTKEVVVEKEVPVTVEVVKEVPVEVVKEAAVEPWALPEKWDQETDVVVVGTGFGLAAAIEAKRAGADVIILEKNEWPGGLTMMAAGANHYCCTHIQKAAGIEDTLEQAFADEMLVNEFRGEPEIYMAYLKMGEDTVTWYEELGLKWRDEVGDGTGSMILRRHSPDISPTGAYPQNRGISQVSVMLTELNKLGVPILYNHRMRAIYRPDPKGPLGVTGPVVGVKVDTPTGTINIKARKAVVLATGNTTGNPQMVKVWDRRCIDPSIYHDGNPYTRDMGDGHFAATAIGAAIANMGFVAFMQIKYGTKLYSYLNPSPLEGWRSSPVAYVGVDRKSGLTSTVPMRDGTDGYKYCIMVANSGKRYVNEMIAQDYIDEYPDGNAGPQIYPGNILKPHSNFLQPFHALPSPKNVWLVTDQEGCTALEWPQEAMRDPQAGASPESTNCLYPDSIAVADTLAELAIKMGVDVANFEATVSRYNGFVDAGVDEDFGKPMPMYKIQTPPFWAAKQNIIMHTQHGGIRTNSKCQVISVISQRPPDVELPADGSVLHGEPIPLDEEPVIPHLYAVGECAHQLGYRRIHRVLGPYSSLGRIAGMNAAKETPWG
jgi:succinate dehydrogenase/fumarate reductase flavoprotein subunit